MKYSDIIFSEGDEGDLEAGEKAGAALYLQVARRGATPHQLRAAMTREREKFDRLPAWWKGYFRGAEIAIQVVLLQIFSGERLLK